MRGVTRTGLIHNTLGFILVQALRHQVPDITEIVREFGNRHLATPSPTMVEPILTSMMTMPGSLLRIQKKH